MWRVAYHTQIGWCTNLFIDAPIPPLHLIEAMANPLNRLGMDWRLEELTEDAATKVRKAPYTAPLLEADFTGRVIEVPEASNVPSSGQ